MNIVHIAYMYLYFVYAIVARSSARIDIVFIRFQISFEMYWIS